MEGGEGGRAEEGREGRGGREGGGVRKVWASKGKERAGWEKQTVGQREGNKLAPMLEKRKGRTLEGGVQVMEGPKE